ncbi:hypothetical protein BDP27DRAFT_1429616 [Rhodocollybia butyracea]|uniref:Uncharacterized protein n=1 Tax=Rhodocollybia butyracea TaxID=206335 RepID=A0A9P5TYU3_9AGAR|nr:hypothetical protein BDP27DRAFT_1429616 [Rhodocollybia butyracea]
MARCRSTSSTVKSREFIDNSDDFEEDASANSVTDLTHDDDTESQDDDDEIQSQPSTDFTMDPEIAAELKQCCEEDVKKSKEALKKAEKKRRADEKKRKADISTRNLHFLVVFDTSYILNKLQAQRLQLNLARKVAKVMRLINEPVTLDSEESYAHLVESLKNTSQVVVYVTKKVADLINESNDKENNKKSKKKSKVPAERGIDPEDNPVNQNIIAIRGQWPCETKSCPSENCWIHPETATHFPLHFKCVERWAMAMLDGPEQATVKSPPNDNLFTTNNEESTVASNVLQQHQARRNSTTTGSNISINITPEVAALLRPAPPPVPLATPVTTATAMLSLLLLPPDRMPGLYMIMANFCTQYGLDNSVTQKLIKLGYANTSSLEYTQVSDLKESGLLPRNIAQLCAAVSEWLVVRAG